MGGACRVWRLMRSRKSAVENVLRNGLTLWVGTYGGLVQVAARRRDRRRWVVGDRHAMHQRSVVGQSSTVFS